MSSLFNKSEDKRTRLQFPIWESLISFWISIDFHAEKARISSSIWFERSFGCSEGNEINIKNISWMNIQVCHHECFLEEKFCDLKNKIIQYDLFNSRWSRFFLGLSDEMAFYWFYRWRRKIWIENSFWEKLINHSYLVIFHHLSSVLPDSILSDYFIPKK